MQIILLRHHGSLAAAPNLPWPVGCGLELTAGGLEFARRPRAPPPGPPAAVLACCCPRRARRRGWGLAAVGTL